MKGKAACLVADKKIEIMDLDIPEVEKGAVLVKVRLSNVCGSDVKMWAGTGVHSGKTVMIGHEYVGEICELGEGVECDYAGNPVKVGDRVVSPYQINCMKCSACLEGHIDQCKDCYKYNHLHPSKWPYFTGSHGTHYYIHPNQFFYKVPDDVDDRLVAGANCALSQVYCGLDIIDVKLGETVLIQGAGGLGLYASAIAKERGATVIIVDVLADRLELAKRFGADYTININEFPTAEDRINETLRLTGGKGVDAAVEVAGASDTFEEALRHLKLKGRYLVMGINNVAIKTTMSPGYIVRKAITIVGQVRYHPKYLYQALLFLQKYKDKYPFGELSDREYSLDELQEVLRLAYEKKIARAVINPRI